MRTENAAENTVDPAFRKRERAKAERAAVGGLRDPRRSVADNPEANWTGNGVNEIIAWPATQRQF